MRSSPRALVSLLIVALLPLLSHGAGTGVGVADLVTTPQNVAVPVDVLANDLDFSFPATVGVTSGPSHGTAMVSGSPGPAGVVLATYTPTAGFVGTDSFTYSVTDGVSNSSATVTVTVLADGDLDGVADLEDNCTGLANATQCDSDGDGYGNRCDGDMNNNTATNAQDYVLFRQQLGQPSVAPTYNKADINCNGVVNAQDYVLFRSLLGTSPGPSARRGAGNSYTVTGTVSGLTGSGLVLRNNGGDNLSISANGPFGFATGLAGSASYAVTVLTQPTGPSQTCTVNNGSGTVNTGSLPNVAVSCTTNAYTLGGVVSGRIAGTSLVLQKNGGEGLAMLGNGYYSFATPLKSGAQYNVTVNAQPANPDQICGLESGAGTGTVVASDIATINVACAISGKWYYSVNTVASTISTYSISATTGALTPVGFPVPTATGPTAVITDPTGRFAYVTSRGASPATTPGTVSFYTIDAATGALSLVNTVPTGKHPRSITLDGTATYAWVANLVDNTVSSYRINGDGSLTALGTAATGASPESVIILTNQSTGGVLTNKYAYVIAGAGKIWVHQVTAGSGTLMAGVDTAVTAGTSTARLTISSQKVTPIRLAYVVNATGNAIQLYTLNTGTGALTLAGTFPTGAGPGALVFNAAGTVAYVPNSGDNTVSVYAVSPVNGFLTPLGSPVATGPTPIYMTLDPGGTLAYVVNSGDGTVSNYSVNPATGALTPTGVTVAVDTTAIVSTPATGLATPYAGNKFALVLNIPSGGPTNNNIQVFSIDTETGALTPTGSPFQGLGDNNTSNEAYHSLAMTPSATFVYKSDQLDNTVSAARLDPLTGELTAVTGSPFATGAGPAGVAVDPRGEFVYVANQTAPNGISGYRISPETGALTPLAGSPFPTAYSPFLVAVDPSGTFAYVAGTDNPLTSNRIWVYRIDRSSGALALISTPTVVLDGATATGIHNLSVGGGTYKVSFKAGTFDDLNTGTNFPFLGDDPGAYTAKEAIRSLLNSSAATTVGPSLSTTDTRLRIPYDAPGLVFSWDSAYAGATWNSGNSSNLADSSLIFAIFSVVQNPTDSSPAVFPIVTTSIAIDPGGRFLFVTNISPTSALAQGIGAFRIDTETGLLSPVPGGPFFGNFSSGASAIAITPNSAYAYAGDHVTGNIYGFQIDPETGALTAVPGPPVSTGASFKAIAVDSTGQYVLTTNRLGTGSQDTVSAFLINDLTGALTPVAGSPFAGGSGPINIIVTP